MSNNTANCTCFACADDARAPVRSLISHSNSNCRFIKYLVYTLIGVFFLQENVLNLAHDTFSFWFYCLN